MGFPAGKNGRRTSLLPWGSRDVLSSSSQKNSTIFFTLPSKSHQSYFFPPDLSVKQGCVQNRISLGLEFMIHGVLRMDLVWCQGRQPSKKAVTESRCRWKKKHKPRTSYRDNWVRALLFLHVKKRSMCLWDIEFKWGKLRSWKELPANVQLCCSARSSAELYASGSPVGNPGHDKESQKLRKFLWRDLWRSSGLPHPNQNRDNFI